MRRRPAAASANDGSRPAMRPRGISLKRGEDGHVKLVCACRVSSALTAQRPRHALRRSGFERQLPCAAGSDHQAQAWTKTVLRPGRSHRRARCMAVDGPGAARPARSDGEHTRPARHEPRRSLRSTESAARAPSPSSRTQVSLDDIMASSRQWLVNRDFQVGRAAHAEGLRKKHAVILVPGIVSSGLESWTTAPEHASFFRQRMCGAIWRRG